MWKEGVPAIAWIEDVRIVVEFDRVFLLRMRREALRKGVWFKVLDCAERAILNLTPRCMEKPKSSKLIDMLAKIIVKIENALESPVDILVGQVGRPLARRLSHIEQKWGHKNAGEWATDDGFCRYLTIVNMNSSSFTRSGLSG